jgi:hypothetical protein
MNKEGIPVFIVIEYEMNLRSEAVARPSVRKAWSAPTGAFLL